MPLADPKLLPKLPLLSGLGTDGMYETFGGGDRERAVLVRVRRSEALWASVWSE